MLQEDFPQSAVSCTSLNVPSLFVGKEAPIPGSADGHEHPTSIICLIDFGGGGAIAFEVYRFLRYSSGRVIIFFI